MTMQSDLAAALNAQINHEFSGAYVYLGISAYFETLDLNGFASWMRAQSDEERAHGMRIFDHLSERDVPITLGNLQKVQTEYDSVNAAVAAGLALEQETTQKLNALWAQAVEFGDYQAKALLDWFVNEQTEEEDLLRTLLSHVKIAGNEGSALLILNRELAER